MPNEFSIVIDGYRVKELRCKNDNCRRLLGYESVKVGIVIFTCDCGTISKYKIGYGEAAKKFIDKLQNKFEEGGEIKNG